MKRHLFILAIILSVFLSGGCASTGVTGTGCCAKAHCACVKAGCCKDGKCSCKGECCAKDNCRCAEGKCAAGCNCQKQ